MSTPYIGEIRMFAGNFAPVGWEFCSGQLIPISENDPLFNLIGTTYGGDGVNTFALPNLCSRIPVHMGQGPNVAHNYILGETAGAETVTLTTQQIPSHTHPMLANASPGFVASPKNAVLAAHRDHKAFRNGTPTNNMAPGVLSPVGGSQPHDNMPPFLCVNFIISMYGVFPTQT